MPVDLVDAVLDLPGRIGGIGSPVPGLIAISLVIAAILWPSTVRRERMAEERRRLLATFNETMAATVEGNGADRYLASRSYLKEHATLVPNRWDRLATVARIAWIVAVVVWARSEHGRDAEVAGTSLDRAAVVSGLVGVAVILLIVALRAGRQHLFARREGRARPSPATTAAPLVPIAVIAALLPLGSAVAWAAGGLSELGLLGASTAARSPIKRHDTPTASPTDADDRENDDRASDDRRPSDDHARDLELDV